MTKTVTKQKASPPTSLPKCKTGIPGLDEITGGGLPKGRPTLVCGGAGCGKTLMGIEFLVRGAMLHNEPGVFLAFEETAEELAQNVRSLGFDLDELIEKKKLAVDYIYIERSEIEETGEYDLEGLFIRLGHAIDSIGAKRVVLDTLETLFSGLSNLAILRSELRRLFRWLKEKGVTSVITAERGEGSLTRHGLEEYVSDCVLLLDHRVEGQISTRRLRVVKYRGSAHATNEFPFLIDEGGVSVLPITSLQLQHKASIERVSSGVPALDAMLGGHGFFRGSSVLVSGTAGVGKTSLSCHAADACCQRNERCLYIAFEESEAQLLRNMRSIGLDLEPWVKKGLLRFQVARPTMNGLEMHLASIHKQVEAFQPHLVIVDPITSFLSTGTDTEASSMMVRLVDYLKSHQITALLTNLNHAGSVLEQTSVTISSLIDTWLLLRDIELNGERNRGLYILKSRGMAHSNQIREFLLTENGVQLTEVYLGPEGVLTGSARLSQEAKEKATAVQRSLEIESKRGERPYRLLVEAMEQGVAVLNSEGVVLYCNPCLAELLKRSVQNITGCTIDSFAAEADQAKITGLWRNVERKSAHEEILLLRQDGTTFPASLAVSVLPLQNLCLLISDLTQQKHYDELIVSKAALLDSEIRYRRLLETAKDGILILDTESGRITDANPFMGELLGYSHEHFLGKELWEIGLFSDKAANEAAVRTLQDKGYIRYEHMPLETSHGLRVEVEVVANAYREDHHKVIQCNIRDITERSRLEKQTQDQASALANQDHRKDEFLAMLSHELRNPLAAITNAVQLLSLQKHEEPLQLQARTIIQRQMGQLIRLVDDLMEVSRITSGRIHLQKERTGLNSIVERAVETTRSLMDQHGHELTVSLSPQPLWLHADASRLEQVVVNLLTNAAKFTTEGGRISIAVQREGDEAVLRVKDKGVGIAAELLPHIFELFTQAERSLDRSQGGLGIGLSLVQRLAEMHEGRVEVSSVMGQGSEFVVYLPVMLNPATQLQSPLEVTAEPIGPSLRVLVVDDNVDAAQTLGLLLKATGHDARMAFDGVNAVKVALEFLPNIVLLDIGLPGLDGYEVAKRLRQDSSLDGVVLVALTGYGQATDKLRSQDAGFNHHLVKPTDFMKIKEILASVSQKTT